MRWIYALAFWAYPVAIGVIGVVALIAGITGGADLDAWTSAAAGGALIAAAWEWATDPSHRGKR